MKSLVIIGMMFCSIGVFAQQSGGDAPKKEQVCVVDRGQAKEHKADMKKAPIQPVNERKVSVKCCKGKPAQKAEVQDQRMVAPIQRKEVGVKSNR